MFTALPTRNPSKTTTHCWILSNSDDSLSSLLSAALFADSILCFALFASVGELLHPGLHPQASHLHRKWRYMFHWESNCLSYPRTCECTSQLIFVLRRSPELSGLQCFQCFHMHAQATVLEFLPLDRLSQFFIFFTGCPFLSVWG